MYELLEHVNSYIILLALNVYSFVITYSECCQLDAANYILAYELLSVIQFHLSTWFNLEMSDWRCRIMIIMIPFQLSVCITEELFAK